MKSNETPPTGTPENTPFSGYIPLAGTISQENSGETGEFSKTPDGNIHLENDKRC